MEEQMYQYKILPFISFLIQFDARYSSVQPVLASVERLPAREPVDEVERPHGLVVRHHVTGVPHQHHSQVAHVLGVARQVAAHVPRGAAGLLRRRPTPFCFGSHTYSYFCHSYVDTL